MGRTIAEGAGGGGGYGQDVCEVWWAGMQWEARMIKKSDHHSKRETRRRERRTKKRPKNKEVKKAIFFGQLVALGLDPTAFLKGPEGCPLDHRSVQIRAFQPESDLLSTHIGSWPKVKLAEMTGLTKQKVTNHGSISYAPITFEIYL